MNDCDVEYEKGWKITEIFPVNGVGMVTARDDLTISFTPDDVRQNVFMIFEH